MVLDQESILAHEQICEYNEVSCIYHTCNKGSSAHKLLDHLKTKHAHDISLPSRNVQMNGTNFLVTLKMKQEQEQSSVIYSVMSICLHLILLFLILRTPIQIN